MRWLKQFTPHGQRLLSARHSTDAQTASDTAPHTHVNVSRGNSRWYSTKSSQRSQRKRTALVDLGNFREDELLVARVKSGRRRQGLFIANLLNNLYFNNNNDRCAGILTARRPIIAHLAATRSYENTPLLLQSVLVLSQDKSTSKSLASTVGVHGIATSGTADRRGASTISHSTKL